jgi:hypothetical protein
MILWLPVTALTGAVLADAAHAGLHKRLAGPRRRTAVSHLRMIATGHGRKHGLSLMRIQVDVDAYVKAIEVYVILQTKQVELEEQARYLEQRLLDIGNMEGAARARDLRLRYAEQRELLEQLAESVAHHKAWLRD